MDEKEVDFVWIFNGEKSSFSSGVFSDISVAEEWIHRHSLTGVLTRYPLNIGAYDYAIKNGLFTPKEDKYKTSFFIGKFSCASFEHYHYEEGKRE